MQINIDAKEKATAFIKSYAEMKSELESKHLANKKTDEHKFLTTIRQGEIKSLERDLEKNKKELEYIPPLLEGLTTSKIELEADKVILFDMDSQCINQTKSGKRKYRIDGGESVLSVEIDSSKKSPNLRA